MKASFPLEVTIPLWFALTISTMVALVFTKKHRNQPIPNSEEFVALALTTAGFIISFQVFLKPIVFESLRSNLEWDDILAWFVGAGFGVYLSIKGIVKTFEDFNP